MKGLFQKVLKGVYPKIPTVFSSDLSAMIRSLLQVDPEKRPSTKQIIHMPVFVAKYNEIREERVRDYHEAEHQIAEGYDDLLGTIKVPRNLKLLSERLPKSNFGQKRSRSTGKTQDTSLEGATNTD